MHRHPMSGNHDKILASAAKSELGQLGFKRKGRSRTWIADHGWWATVVEFQPSAWSKGSYLNVSAHWLWSSHDFLSFDFGGRLEEHVQYASDGQFVEEARRLAVRAAQEAQRLYTLFETPLVTAKVLLAEELRINSRAWPAYHAGVAAGIAGLETDAREMFTRVAYGYAEPDSLLAQCARQIDLLIGEPQRLREVVGNLVLQHRAALRLPPLSDPLI